MHNHESSAFYNLFCFQYHMIHEDGSYEYVVIGDVQLNDRAHYTVIVPGGTYMAAELLTEEFALLNVVNTPSKLKNRRHIPLYIQKHSQLH